MNDRQRRMYAVRAASVLNHRIVRSAVETLLLSYDGGDDDMELHDFVRDDLLRVASLVTQVAFVMSDGLDPDDLPMAEQDADDAESSLGGVDGEGFHAEVMRFDMRPEMEGP